MNREFQVLYQSSGESNLQTIPVVAETENEARCLIENPKREVISIKEIRPLLDWNQKTFSKEEAAVYLRCTSSQIDKLMAEGKLPKSKNGRPLFTRTMLDRVIEQRMIETQ
jgi:hypothetical protein